jgi:arginine decarboxylase-like protein
MKQTAVDYIFHTFYNEDNISDYVLRIFEQAKEMEKQQIIDAHLKGQREDIDFINEAKKEAEQYYNETFKSE